MKYTNIFDSHAHYDDERFDCDRDEVIKALAEKGVTGAINIGCNLERSEQSIELAEKYPMLYASVGVHPEDAENLPEDYLLRLEELAGHEKAVAIGEIGLDYHYEGYSAEAQKKVFREQLALAKRLDMPVIIHSRDAAMDTLEILREFKPRGVVHCFSGSEETAREILSLGMYISFTGVLTFKNAKRAAAACSAVPEDRLLLETDSPYMAPEPVRGTRCDSSLIPYIAEKVAELRGSDAQSVIDKCTENTKRLFAIGI